MDQRDWKIHNSSGSKRVVVTKELPGTRWLDILTKADCKVEICETTHQLINGERLDLMKENAILVNSSRGRVIDETALVTHCQKHPNFRVALDVFEDEPEMKPGLSELDNVVIVPHIASATIWTREGMATLAASNVAGILMGYPAWQDQDTSRFLGDDPPRAAPSIVNAKEVGVPPYAG